MKKTKEVKTTTEPKVKSRGKCINLKGIMGVLMLFVIASIVFSTYMVVMGTDNLTMKLLCVPQAMFAGLVLVYLSYNN